MRGIFIIWKDDYNTGVPIVDEHHRGIVSNINSLYYAMKEKHGVATLRPVVHMVKEYTRIHFCVEEAAHKRNKFPEAKHHHLIHADLTSKLKSVGAESLINAEPGLFLEFLKNWWIEHICNEDRKFTAFLQQEGCSLDI